MPEIASFVSRGAASITPGVVQTVVRHLPQWRLEFSQINEPKYPHLVDQLELLANAVEDSVDGSYKDLPYGILDLGRADDSSVVRAVLIQHERAFAIYAGKQNIDWATITSRP